MPPGEATVHCESGPQQQDGPEQLSATFSFRYDPNGVFTDDRPDCPDVTTLGPTNETRSIRKPRRSRSCAPGGWDRAD